MRALYTSIWVIGCEAFWRMPCAKYAGLYRVDPVVSPGVMSSHAHALHGGYNINISVTYEDMIASESTSCGVQEDSSAYWSVSH